MTFSLRGQFLVAMPDMRDERFAQAVVYICSHSQDDGAIGLVINKLMPDLQFADLLAQFDVKVTHTEEGEQQRLYHQPILLGGPVDTERGFILHTPDYVGAGHSTVISDGLCLSTTMDVLRSIASGNGPTQSLLALGYCGWQPGQLEGEISDNGWLTAPASSELVFDTPMDQRYKTALKIAGIDIAFLATGAGHA